MAREQQKTQTATGQIPGGPAAASGSNTGTPVGHKNEKVGQVVSTKMAKTIVVEVTRRVAHPVYKRIVSKRNKFYAHDEQGTAQVGDVVRIIECRPLSRLKRWQLGTVIRKAVQVTIEHPALAQSADTRTKKTIKKKKKK
jgi:small subunit ribosomal protein S17